MQKQKYLLGQMNKADTAISKMYKKAVVLIGQTKAGTTTVFNWLTRRPMIGRGKVRPIYCNLNQNDPIISNKYPTTTLTPNVEVDFLQNISLVDMPGFNSINRNYIDVSTPILSLRFLFQHIQSAKFVLLFNQTTILSQNIFQATKTITDFLTYFDLESLSNKQIMKMLKRSILIVVTGSTYSLQDTFIILNQIIALTRENQLDLKVQLMLQILEEVVACGSVELFKQARNYQIPQQPFDFNHRFLSKDQYYFNFRQATQLAQQQITNTSLRIQKKMNSQQKQKFKKQVCNEVQFCFKKFIAIVHVAIKQFFRFMRGNNRQKICVDEFYNLLQKTIKSKQHYESVHNLNSQKAKYEQKIVNFSSLYWLKKIIKISELSTSYKYNESQLSHQQIIDKVNNIISELLDEIQVMVQNQQQWLLILKLKQIMRNQLQYLKQLYQTFPDTICDIEQIMNWDIGSQLDYTNQQYDWPFKIYYELIAILAIQKISTVCLYDSQVDQCLQIIIQTQHYDQNNKLQSKKTLLIKLALLNINIYRTQILNDQGHHLKSIQTCLSVLKLTRTARKEISISDHNGQLSQQQISRLQTRDQEILQNMHKLFANPFAKDLKLNDKLVKINLLLLQKLANMSSNCIKENDLWRNNLLYSRNQTIDAILSEMDAIVEQQLKNNH